MVAPWRVCEARVRASVISRRVDTVSQTSGTVCCCLSVIPLAPVCGAATSVSRKRGVGVFPSLPRGVSGVCACAPVVVLERPRRFVVNRPVDGSDRCRRGVGGFARGRLYGVVVDGGGRSVTLSSAQCSSTSLRSVRLSGLWRSDGRSSECSASSSSDSERQEERDHTRPPCNLCTKSQGGR